MAVTEDSDRAQSLKSIGYPGQTVHGVSHRKGFSFIVGAAGAIIPAGTHHFLLFLIEDDEPPCSMPVLGPSIELHVDVGAGGKTGLWGQCYGIYSAVLAYWPTVGLPSSELSD